MVKFLIPSARRLYLDSTSVKQATYVYANPARVSFLMKMTLRNSRMMVAFLSVVYGLGTALQGLVRSLEVH